MPVQVDLIESPDDFAFYRAKVTFSGTSDYILMRSSMTRISVGIYPASTVQSRVQYTLSTPAEIVAVTAVWLDWPIGQSNKSQSDVLIGPVTAVRGVTAGTATLEVCAV